MWSSNRKDWGEQANSTYCFDTILTDCLTEILQENVVVVALLDTDCLILSLEMNEDNTIR